MQVARLLKGSDGTLGDAMSQLLCSSQVTLAMVDLLLGAHEQFQDKGYAAYRVVYTKGVRESDPHLCRHAVKGLLPLNTHPHMWWLLAGWVHLDAELLHHVVMTCRRPQWVGAEFAQCTPATQPSNLPQALVHAYTYTYTYRDRDTLYQRLVVQEDAQALLLLEELVQRDAILSREARVLHMLLQGHLLTDDVRRDVDVAWVATSLVTVGVPATSCWLAAIGLLDQWTPRLEMEVARSMLEDLVGASVTGDRTQDRMMRDYTRDEMVELVTVCGDITVYGHTMQFVVFQRWAELAEERMSMDALHDVVVDLAMHAPRRNA